MTSARVSSPTVSPYPALAFERRRLLQQLHREAMNVALELLVAR